MKYAFSHGKKSWFLKHIDDPFVKKSQQLNLRSRAAFKLQQIQTKYKILGNNILDLGSAPGSWSQMVKLLKPESQTVAVDILHMNPIIGVTFYRQNATTQHFYTTIKSNHQPFNTIISDMAPNFGGNDDQTHQQIIDLNQTSVQLSFKLGMQKSNLLMKSLYGELQKPFFMFLQLCFQRIHRFKPQASRKKSNQFYYVCQNRIQSTNIQLQKLKNYKFTKNLTKNDLIESIFKK